MKILFAMTMTAALISGLALSAGWDLNGVISVNALFKMFELTKIIRG